MFKNKIKIKKKRRQKTKKSFYGDFEPGHLKVYFQINFVI